MARTYVSTSLVSYPETAALVADMTDDEIFALKRGGHEPSKLFAAFNNAEETKRSAQLLS